jgi:hypothetical protein
MPRLSNQRPVPAIFAATDDVVVAVGDEHHAQRDPQDQQHEVDRVEVAHDVPSVVSLKSFYHCTDKAIAGEWWT